VELLEPSTCVREMGVCWLSVIGSSALLVEQFGTKMVWSTRLKSLESKVPDVQYGLWVSSKWWKEKLPLVRNVIIYFVAGYGNQEKKELSDLKDTFGKRSRDRQRREAQMSNLAAEPDVEEYYSSVSLTSSMYNNCNDSIVREREEDRLTNTTTTECSGHPRSSKFSTSAIPKNHLINNNAKENKGKNKRARDEVDTTTADADSERTSGLDPLDQAEEIVVPSAEATIFSSSDHSSVGDDSDDEAEATSAGPYGDALKGFPNMIPRLPIPPMPMSLAGPDGKFDYGRGQLPSLLLSWYMSGYHAGYFDARREVPSSSPNRANKEDKAASRTNKRQ
jgi:hypothetical protein